MLTMTVTSILPCLMIYNSTTRTIKEIRAALAQEWDWHMEGATCKLCNIKPWTGPAWAPHTFTQWALGPDWLEMQDMLASYWLLGSMPSYAQTSAYVSWFQKFVLMLWSNASGERWLIHLRCVTPISGIIHISAIECKLYVIISSNHPSTHPHISD